MSPREDRTRIVWHRDDERRYPFGTASPDPDRLEPLGFPPPWATRPWIYGNVITSKNGVIAWNRAGADDDPVCAIAGGDFTRPGRLADQRLMRYLRACADACSVGAQTLRDQPDLIGVPDDIDGGLGELLSRFRVTHGLRRFPLQVVYSESGRVDLDLPMFNTPDLTAIIATTEAGARRLHAQGGDRKGIRILRAGEERIDARGLVRVHEWLFEECGVRYLVCEGGATMLTALDRAGILDELFVTSTDVEVGLSLHDGVKRMAALDTGAGRLIAEGRAAADPGYTFQRWRFAER